jgi:hypothetical protein
MAALLSEEGEDLSWLIEDILAVLREQPELSALDRYNVATVVVARLEDSLPKPPDEGPRGKWG